MQSVLTATFHWFSCLTSSADGATVCGVPGTCLRLACFFARPALVSGPVADGTALALIRASLALLVRIVQIIAHLCGSNRLENTE